MGGRTDGGVGLPTVEIGVGGEERIADMVPAAEDAAPGVGVLAGVHDCDRITCDVVVSDGTAAVATTTTPVRCS